MLAQIRGDVQQAIRYHQQGLAVAWRSGNIRSCVHAIGNIAGALAGFLSLSPEERGDHSETVRRNSVETLGWGTLAEKVAGIFVMTNEASGHSGGGSGMTSR